MALPRLLLAAIAALGACAPAAERPGSLRVAFFTGGGYHDYKTLAPLLTAKIAELADVTFDVKWTLKDLQDARDFSRWDAVVYDTCYDDPGNDPGLIERLRSVTREGKPAVFIHCAVHTFRISEDWARCCGQLSRTHAPYQAFSTEKVDPGHPVLQGWPDDWRTEGDELYKTLELYEHARPLLKAKGTQDVVCWTATYGKGRIFATTLGHDLKTAGRPEYHRLLARGLLWACGRLDR